jgi:hypothetical protein
METAMMHPNITHKTSHPLTLAGAALVTMIALMILGCAQSTFAQSLPKTFVSASQASQALYEAVKNKDDEAVQAILGAGPELTSSGDEAADRLERERFAQKYEEMHRLVREPDGSVVLYIGAENWPFPIPLVANNGAWHFDSDAGADEIMARRIGENETLAIEVCQAIGKPGAQNAKAVTSEDPVRQFAHRLTSAGNANSANIEFYEGYYYRVLTGLPSGVVLVAYPAEYRSSGVMTFIVTGSGSVYEKDLGSKTESLASQIQGKPVGKWNRVQ